MTIELRSSLSFSAVNVKFVIHWFLSNTEFHELLAYDCLIRTLRRSPCCRSRRWTFDRGRRPCAAGSRSRSWAPCRRCSRRTAWCPNVWRCGPWGCPGWRTPYHRVRRRALDLFLLDRAKNWRQSLLTQLVEWSLTTQEVSGSNPV